MSKECHEDTLFKVVIDKTEGSIADVVQKGPFANPPIRSLEDLSRFWQTYLDMEAEPLLHFEDKYIFSRIPLQKHIVYTITYNPYLLRFIKDFEQRTIRDPLTQAFTKSYALEVLHTLLMQFLRYRDKKFSVMMLDLDHFKKINDTYGHLCGDLVLKKVSELILQSLRHSDIFARFGGEEFVIILPNTNVAGALKLAERIRKTVEQYDFRCQGKKIPVTISVGITSVALNDSVHSLLERADEALYEAKRGGRNRVEYK